MASIRSVVTSSHGYTHFCTSCQQKFWGLSWTIFPETFAKSKPRRAGPPAEQRADTLLLEIRLGPPGPRFLSCHIYTHLVQVSVWGCSGYLTLRETLVQLA